MVVWAHLSCVVGIGFNTYISGRLLFALFVWVVVYITLHKGCYQYLNVKYNTQNRYITPEYNSPTLTHIAQSSDKKRQSRNIQNEVYQNHNSEHSK